jgi:hypothetical protein
MQSLLLGIFGMSGWARASDKGRLFSGLSTSSNRFCVACPQWQFSMIERAEGSGALSKGRDSPSNRLC